MILFKCPACRKALKMLDASGNLVPLGHRKDAELERGSGVPPDGKPARSWPGTLCASLVLVLAVIAPLPLPAQQSESQPQKKAQLRTADAIVEARLAASEEELSKQLFEVPELRLVNDLDVQVLLKSTNLRSKTADRNSVTAMLHQTLVQAGLNAGLPLRGGAQARLRPSAALVVEELSKSLRDMWLAYSIR